MRRALTPDAVRLSHHVDALEVSCAVEQVALLLVEQPDELEAKLDVLRRRARRGSPPSPIRSGWTWSGDGASEPVVAQPRGKRPGRPHCLTTTDWMIFVAPPRSLGPRLSIQLRSDFLSRAGALTAYQQVRAWTEDALLPLIGGVPEEAVPRWNISRLDLAADVVGVHLTPGALDRFTTRARLRRSHHQASSDHDA